MFQDVVSPKPVLRQLRTLSTVEEFRDKAVAALSAWENRSQGGRTRDLSAVLVRIVMDLSFYF
jgi:hypothetical protein